jgi:hypothetical protein
MNECFPEINRLTINRRIFDENKRIHEIKFLKYPPQDLVKTYGRCNQPNESVLYAAFGIMTVLNECRPHVGDLITESTWKVKDDQNLKFCPIFRNQPEGEVINPRTFQTNREFERLLRDYPKNTKAQIVDLTQFVADAFSKRINSNNHLDSVFSAYFSSKIFNELENGTIEAIYYPSVKDRLSFENISIKPTSFDQKYELVKVQESVVTIDPSSESSGYGMQTLADSDSFDHNNQRIVWKKENIRQPKDRLEMLARKSNLNLK